MSCGATDWNRIEIKGKAIKDCRNSLRLTDPEDDRNALVSAKGKRVDGTCAWIQEDGTYLRWLRGELPLLWIWGGPGKGKTMLSIYLTEELEQERRVIYFFCSSEDEKRNTAAAVLRGLLWQITAYRPDLTEQLLDHFDTPEKTKEALSCTEVLWRMFVKLCRHSALGQIVCVLDGLDECDNTSRDWLAGKLVDSGLAHRKWSLGDTVKTIVVSREIPILRRVGLSAQINLDSDNDMNVQADLKRFVSSRVQELSEVIGFDDGFRGAVEEILLERAEGTFLWVGFVMTDLLKKSTSYEIVEALSTLPLGLPALYDRMLLLVAPEHRQSTRLILRWVTLAVRPLSLRELAAAIGCNATPLLSIDQVITDQVALCSQFLVIQGQNVGLVHHSARDYLLDDVGERNATLAEFHIQQEESHLQMAWDCLDCMDGSSWSMVYRKNDWYSDPQPYMVSNNPFLNYAAKNWALHAAECPEVVHRLLEHPSRFFDAVSQLREKWQDVYENGQLAGISALHIACYLGIIPWAEALLVGTRPRFKSDMPVRRKRLAGRYPLHLAALAKDIAMVHLLLDHNADVNAKDSNGHTALHFVVDGVLDDDASEEAIAIAGMLIQRGADVNPQWSQQIFEVDPNRPCLDKCKHYVDSTLKNTEASNNLDILCTPWLPEGPHSHQEKLPSWIQMATGWPFAKETTSYALEGSQNKRKYRDPLVHESTYNACNSVRADHWRFGTGPDDSQSLFVSGFVLDEIREIAKYSQEGNIPQSWLALAGWQRDSYDPDRFWRTIVADRGPDGTNAKDYYAKALESAINNSTPGAGIETTRLMERGNSIWREFLERMMAVVWNLRLFESAMFALLGLAPKYAHTGDSR